MDFMASSVAFIKKFGPFCLTFFLLMVASFAVGLGATLLSQHALKDVDTAGQTQFLAARVFYFAQEMVYSEQRQDSDAADMFSDKLITSGQRLTVVYNNLVYGNSTLGLSPAVDRNTEFRHLLFHNRCLRRVSPCPTDDVFASGLDSTMRQYGEDSEMLARAHRQPNLDMGALWTSFRDVAELDVGGGLAEARDIFGGEIDWHLTAPLAFQSVVLCVVTVGCLFCSLRVFEPHFLRLIRQASGVASLLSFMPRHVPVTNLVVQTLIALDVRNSHLSAHHLAQLSAVYNDKDQRWHSV